MKDPVYLDEARHDREQQEAAERLERKVERLLDTVMNEIIDGKHDDDIYQSPFIDSGLLTCIARKRALGQLPYVKDESDLELQIKDYARDVAERRATR